MERGARCFLHGGAGIELIMAVGAPGVGAGTWAWGNRFLWGYELERDDPVIEATVAEAVAAGFVF